mgnify:CR=1 FL=1
MDNENNKVLQVRLDEIIPNPFQPRLAFNEEKIQELADSIKLHGIIQPLVLRKNGEKYEIIAGERRYKAASLAGLSTVPAIINNMDNNESAEVALVENLQRKNLTPIEEAKSYEKLQQRGYSQEMIAKKMGISQSSIANKLRLLNLDEEIQNALLEEKISERHARSLLSVADKEKQKELLHRIINERLTVRQLDDEIHKLNNILTKEKEEPKLTHDDINSLTNLETLFNDLPTSTTNIEPIKDEIPSVEVFDLPILESNVSNSNISENTKKPEPSISSLDVEVDPTATSDNLSFPEPKFNPEPIKVNDTWDFNISKDDFSSVVKVFDKLKKEIEKAGFSIIMETFDFEEYYQLIIKIFKD